MPRPATVANGDATDFVVRVGPDYKRHGKKAPSAMHVYEPVSVDLIKGSSIRYHLSERLNLHPVPDPDVVNDSGLPRRLVVNTIVPAEAPSPFGGSTDGACYQLVLTFATTTERLKAWRASGSPACALFRRFYDEATTDPPNLDIKERWKLVAKINNFKKLGLPSWLERYNGKPALITKSGSVFRGHDYLEVGMNTFRFAFITRKGVSSLLGRLKEMEFHFAVTVEGRDDAELPEQLIATAQVTNLDFVGSAVEPGDFSSAD